MTWLYFVFVQSVFVFVELTLTVVTVLPADIGLPAELDWRTKLDIGPLYSQGACSGCWAYSTVGPLYQSNSV
jgi:C1A family cysteine protease